MSDSAIIKLADVEEFRDCIFQLAKQAKKQIVIFTPDLEPELYDSRFFLEPALALIKRSRYTRIRILALETKYLTAQNHPVLKLFRQSDEQVQLKKFSADPASENAAYFICDDHSIVRRQNYNLYEGMCYTDDRARVKDQLEDFNLLWNTAYTDPNLRQLTL